MIPARYERYVFGLLISGFMSCIVSGIATLRALGPVEGFVGLWMNAWLPSWCVAFVVLLIFSPVVRRIVRLIVAEA